MAKSASPLQLVPAIRLRSPQTTSKFLSLALPGITSLFVDGLLPGTITQIQGPRSSGRTAVSAYVLAQATARGYICALVDSGNQFHPESLRQAGVDLNKLVWVQCNGNADHAMRAADLLLHAGGFGILWLDLCDLPAKSLQKVPFSYWHRFRNAIQNTATSLVVSSNVPVVSAHTNHNLQLHQKALDWQGTTSVLAGVQASAKLERVQQTASLALRLVI